MSSPNKSNKTIIVVKGIPVPVDIPVWLVKEIHQDFARTLVWLHTENFHWFQEGMNGLAAKLNGRFGVSETQNPIVQLQQVWAFIVSFWRTASFRKIRAVRDWLREDYDIRDYLTTYNIEKYEAQIERFRQLVQEHSTMAVSLEITSSPEFDPFELDNPQPEYPIVPKELIQAENELREIKSRPTTFNLLAEIPANEFDTTDSEFEPEVKFNDEVDFAVVSPPPKRKRLYSPKHSSDFDREVLEEDLVSPRPGHVCFPSAEKQIDPIALEDPFFGYTSPPDYPYVRPHAPTPVHEQTPLQSKPTDLSCTDRTNRPWNKPALRHKPIYRKWVAKMKAKAQAKLERKDDEEKKDPDGVGCEKPSDECAEKYRDFFKQVVPARETPILLYGGVKEAKPPHLIQHTRQVANNYQSSLGGWFYRNVNHHVSRRGAGFIEHFYRINTPAPFPVSEHLAGIAGRIVRYAISHALQHTHKNYRGGFVPRVQYVFRRARGGAYRRSKVLSAVDAEALDMLLRGLYLDTLEERHTGMDDEDDDSDLYGLRVLVPEHEIEGGCDARSHTHNFQDYKIITMKSKFNNCGIACLLYHTKKFTQHNTIRKNCGLEFGAYLSVQDLERVADHLAVGFRLWEEDAGVLNVIHQHRIELAIVADILHNRIMKHYSILQFLDEKKQCTLCGKYIRKKDKHVCNPRAINFYRKFKLKDLKPVAEFDKLGDEPRNMDNVYVFDLETFPEKENIHTVYACKTQCVGTKQEWLGYGEHGEPMRALYEISSRYMPMEYEDLNPDSDTGAYQYKKRGGKWRKVKYAPPEYTRDEAIEQGWGCMLQLRNMDAVGQGAAYKIEEDEKEGIVYVKSEAGRVAGKWCYSSANSKENVLNRIKGMKDYDDCVFIAHNLARFDGSFLFNYLLQKGVEPTFVINSGRIISLKWFNSQVWDTYLFIPESLKSIAKTFKCKVQKGDFDHTLIKTWSDVNKYKESSPGGMGWGVYLDYDVYSLREIVEVYAKNVHDQFHIDVFNFVTLSNMTYKLWGQTTLEQNALVETPQKERYDFIKDAIYGGRVFPMQKEFVTQGLTMEQQCLLTSIHQALDAGHSLDEIEYDEKEVAEMWQACWDSHSFLMNMDMNSLYPTGMCMDYPVGVGEWSTNPERDFKKGYLGIYQIEFVPPPDLVLAILPQRNKKYVSAADNKLENKRWKSSSIRWSLEPSVGVYTSVDIELAFKYKYKIKFLPRAMVWKEKQKIFKPYIEEIYKLKKAQDQLENTEAYNPILRMLAKNMMNSLFGKTCQRPIQDKQQIIKDEHEFYTFAQDYEITDYVWVDIKGKSCLAVSGSPAEVENRKPSHFGAFVLAYSRKIMTEDFDRCCSGLKESNFTYTDTDSIHMYGKVYKEMLQKFPERFGSELGQFSNDIKGLDPIIVYEYALAPKCYVYVYITRDGKVGLKKKVKGLTKQIMQQITMDDFAQEKTKTMKFDSMKRNLFAKDKAGFTIENVQSERTFLKNKFSRMLYIEETKQFRPFGYMGVQDEKEPEPIVEAKEEKEEKSHRVYETNLSDRWFFRQEPAIHLSKSRLVCWLNEHKTNKKQIRHYSRLDVSDMTKVLSRLKDEGAYLYEVTEDACRLFCDVDLDRKFDDETDPALLLQQVCDCIIRAAQKFDVILRLEDLRLLSATTEKKFSFHVSSPEHVFPSAYHQKKFWEVVVEISKEYPLLWREEQPGFDMPIYHKHRCMRTIYSRKPNKQMLEPVNVNLDVLDLKESEIEEYFVVAEPNSDWTPLSKAPDLKKIKRAKAALVLKPGGTLPKDIQELFQRNREALEGFDLESGEAVEGIIKLQRIKESTCALCKRNHTHENGFVKLGLKPYFSCYRNTKDKLYLSTGLE